MSVQLAPPTQSTDTTDAAPAARPLWNPYVAGIALGLVLLASYLLFGWGLGSSSAPTRAAIGAMHAVAPAATEANAYFGPYVADGGNIFEDWMVFEVIGVFLGGLTGAYASGRLKFQGVIDKGPRISAQTRVAMALFGGVILGFAARLARGCTSGQALTGGAVLAAGSWAFMLMVFAGAYLAAPLVRRTWR